MQIVNTSFSAVHSNQFLSFWG